MSLLYTRFLVRTACLKCNHCEIFCDRFDISLLLLRMPNRGMIAVKRNGVVVTTFYAKVVLAIH